MRFGRFRFGVGVVLMLAGCDLAPKYTPPAIEIPAGYKEAGPWHEAHPDDAAPRGAWWQVYGDTQLNDLRGGDQCQ